MLLIMSGTILTASSNVSEPQTSEVEVSVADTLFHHILDSDSLDLFPGLPSFKLPFGMSVHFFMLLLTLILLVTVFLAVFHKPKERPSKLAIALEMIVLFVRDDIVYPIMGEKRGRKWLPFFTSLFLFILVINILGLIPAFKTATGNITVSSALALIMLILTFVVGFGRLGFYKFFRNMYPDGSPVPIGIFVLILEFFSTIIKNVVLSLRLFANMFAGHMAILSFLVLIFVLHPLFAFVSLPFAVFTYTLEVLIALLQALVFTLLSCIFITMASTSHDASEEGAHE